MSIDWEYLALAALAVAVSLGVSLAAVSLILVKLPATYFLEQSRPPLADDRHPAVRLLLRILKNVLGLCLIVVGLMLSLPGIPGQGLLTVLIGVMLLDFPGKHRWERKLVAQPRVLAVINRLRKRFGKLPLKIPGDSEGGG